MTVKLLMDWPDSRDGKNYLAGNLLTTDSGTESGLVSAKMATSTLTGGTNYVAPAVQIQISPVMAQTNPPTGGNELSANGVRVPVPFVVYARHTPSSAADTTTSEVELCSVPLPVGTLGPNDALRITHLWTYPNSATAKSLKIYIGASLVMSFGVTTTQKHQGMEIIRNRGSLISQISNNDQVPFGPRAAGTLANSIDFGAEQVLKFVGAWGTAGAGSNLITLESVIIEVVPGV